MYLQYARFTSNSAKIIVVNEAIMFTSNWKNSVAKVIYIDLR